MERADTAGKRGGDQKRETLKKQYNGRKLYNTVRG